jgi:MFS family permease
VFRGIDRNYWLGLWNGWLVAVGDAFFQPNLIMNTFLERLGAPNVTIGLIPALRTGGWLVPQLFMASYLSGRPRVNDVYRKMTWFRGGALLAIAALGFLGGALPAPLLVAGVLAAVLVNALCSGIAGLPWTTVMGKVIPERRRSELFGTRQLFGGLGAFAAGIVARQILDPATGLEFPASYAVLFLAGALLATIAWYLWGLVDEPADPTPGVHRTLLEELRQGPRLVRQDPDLRRYITSRSLFFLGTIADPFYAIFAIQALGATAGAIGMYLIAYQLFTPASNILWSWLGRNHGTKAIARYSALAGAGAPVLAILLLLLPPGPASVTAFALVFVLQGAALNGQSTAGNNLLLEIAPRDLRPTYVGLANSVLGIASFAPLLGGLLIDWLGFGPLFGVALILQLAGWHTSRRIVDSHGELALARIEEASGLALAALEGVRLHETGLAGPPEGARHFAFVLDGEVLGGFWLKLGEREALLGGLVVRPDHRGRGISSRLVEVAAGLAARAGADSVVAVIGAGRRDAALVRGLLERHGFVGGREEGDLVRQISGAGR